MPSLIWQVIIPTAAEGDIAVEHFAFHGGINPGKQLGYRVKMGAIFVTQRQVQQQVLNRMQADLRQFTALRSAHTGESAERNGIEQAA